MHRIGGRLRSRGFGFYGVAVGIPLFDCCGSNLGPINWAGDIVRWAV